MAWLNLNLLGDIFFLKFIIFYLIVRVRLMVFFFDMIKLFFIAMLVYEIVN